MNTVRRRAAIALSIGILGAAMAACGTSPENPSAESTPTPSSTPATESTPAAAPDLNRDAFLQAWNGDMTADDHEIICTMYRAAPDQSVAFFSGYGWDAATIKNLLGGVCG